MLNKCQLLLGFFGYLTVFFILNMIDITFDTNTRWENGFETFHMCNPLNNKYIYIGNLEAFNETIKVLISIVDLLINDCLLNFPRIV